MSNNLRQQRVSVDPLGSKALEYLPTKECFLEKRGGNVKDKVKVEDFS